MDRGQIGILPRPTSLADESYLEFVTSFRKFAIQQGFPAVAATGEAALAKALDKGEVGRPDQGKEIPMPTSSGFSPGSRWCRPGSASSGPNRK